MIALLVITDGRKDCIQQAIASADAMLKGPITYRLIYNDNPDYDYEFWLRHMYGTDFEIRTSGHRLGFGGAIWAAWQVLSQLLVQKYVFHLEDDFTFNRPVSLTRMMHVLDRNPSLIQLALRRQPWNSDEQRAGGVVELWPQEYDDVYEGDNSWLEHRLFFTTNPSLYRRELCAQGWPRGDRSEVRFTEELLTDPAVRFGYWGARNSGEWVTHIGTTRSGVTY